MITIARLSQIFDDIQTELGIEFWRANYKLERPNYPYGTWMKVIENQQDEWQHVRTADLNDEDDTLFDITKRKYSESIVSVNVVCTDYNNKDGLELAFDNCRKIINFLGDKEYNDLVIYIKQPSPEDRTVYLDDVVYEYKAGFDINITYTENVTRQVEAMSRLEIENETAYETIVVEWS